jgi:tRNA(fMet)-specific endonuclease VapC
MISGALLDTDILSEIIKRRDINVQRRAQAYLADHGQFQFSIVTRYEILRGLKAKDAFGQALAFDRQCARSTV